jgi:hypothetical protein
MPDIPCEAEGAHIILVGHFNPSIFQPAWLAAHDLIRKEEAEAAKIQVIASEVASFTSDWLSLVVTDDKFQALTNDPSHYEPLRDLVLGIFLLLEHTPFEKMGINRDMHFRMPTEEAWHQLGHLLTPKELWRSHLEKPGMESITIGGSPKHAPDSHLRVKVEPSTRVKPCGVYVGTNQHHQASGPDAARQLMVILREKWQTSQEYARVLSENLVNEGYRRAINS